MKRNLLFVLMSFVIVCCLTGCGSKLPNLKSDASGFKMESIVDNSDGMEYGTIEYKGRKYIPYGTTKNVFNNKSVKECVGYIIQDESNSLVADPNDKDNRVYTLVEDKENNFLLVYYVGTNLMNSMEFWRAEDTKGKDIKIPDYINSFDYNIWH